MTLKRNYLFGTTVLAGLMAVTAPALAQTAPTTGAGQDEPEATQVEEVVVTGSRIRRDPTTSPTPVIQVSREDLDRSGQTSIIEYLATIPALSNSTLPADTTAGVLNAGGLSLPNLRSLGTGRTLTLVDGRRHVGSAAGTLSVDTDTIPRLLIENIEIVTGGASSVYGADAVSGVLNFNLRRDYEGLEIDTRLAQINQDGQMQYRVGILAGANLMDDRLNIYAFGEYEKSDDIQASDLDWLRDADGFYGNDSDAASPTTDGVVDAVLASGLRSLQLVKWGQVTLANQYQPSPLTDPDQLPTNTAATGPCTAPTSTTTIADPVVNAQCFGVAPGKTYVFDGPNARLANFGLWAQQTGLNRVVNIGGDGENPNTTFNVSATYPKSESKRFQVGANFSVSPALNLHAEAKYIDEQTNLATGDAFGTLYIADSGFNPATDSQPNVTATSQAPSSSTFFTRTDNAFLPANLRDAIRANTAVRYCTNTAGCAGGVAYGAALNGGVPQSLPFARYNGWLVERPQQNFRELQRYVISADGELGDIAFLRDVNYDIGYTFGRADNYNIENGMDGERMLYAIDSVVDTAGVVNGRPGEIVCRVQLLTANGGTVTNRNPFVPGNGATSTAVTGVGSGPAQIGASDPDIANCRPLNAFGEGNQSEAALNYVKARVFVDQVNEQHDAMASISGQLWDFWGAGSIGIALGAEMREEYTQGLGRGTALNGRLLQLNGGSDQPAVSYDTKEYFGELSIPLLRDSWMGDYAELSASYRSSDFSTFGKADVYGVNLVYRPIRDLAFKTSFNTSVRAPQLGELFGPRSQTFLLFTDPCDALNIQNLANREFAANRIVNCAVLAQRQGLNFNFSDATAANAFRPTYISSVPGNNQGNPNLVPEESESFTFSTVIQPRFIPNFSLVLDYYEIEIQNVIAAVSAAVASTNCVNGPTVNEAACATLTRSPTNFALTGFIQGSINYAKRTVRGLDYTVSYRLDTEEAWGRNWGRFNYRLNGSWLIEQKNFNDSTNPANFTELASTVSGTLYPRTRFTSTLTWIPSDRLSISWDADFQTAVDSVQPRNFVANPDNRDPRYLSTGNFLRHDFSVRYNLDDQTTLRLGVVNAFDEEPAAFNNGVIYTSQDIFGRRFSIGLNYRPF